MADDRPPACPRLAGIGKAFEASWDAAWASARAAVLPRSNVVSLAAERERRRALAGDATPKEAK